MEQSTTLTAPTRDNGDDGPIVLSTPPKKPMLALLMAVHRKDYKQPMIHALRIDPPVSEHVADESQEMRGCVGRELIEYLLKSGNVIRKPNHQITGDAEAEKAKKLSKYEELVAAMNSILEQAIDRDEVTPENQTSTTQATTKSVESNENEDDIYHTINELQLKLGEILSNNRIRKCKSKADRVKKSSMSGQFLEILESSLFGGANMNDNNFAMEKMPVKTEELVQNEHAMEDHTSLTDLNDSDKPKRISKRENRRMTKKQPANQRRGEEKYRFKLIRNRKQTPYFTLTPVNRNGIRQQKLPRNGIRKYRKM